MTRFVTSVFVEDGQLRNFVHITEYMGIKIQGECFELIAFCGVKDEPVYICPIGITKTEAQSVFIDIVCQKCQTIYDARFKTP